MIDRQLPSKRLRQLLLPLAATLAVLLSLYASNLMSGWDRFIYDFGIRFWQRSAPQDIVIIGIDDRSLKAIGRWPWPRQVHAQLLDKLTTAGVAAVAFDIMFSEADSADPGADVALAEAIRRNGRTVLPIFASVQSGNAYPTEVRPLPALEAAAARLGHVDVELDADAIARSVYLKAGVDVPAWPTLALAMLEIAEPGRWQELPGQRRPEPVSGQGGRWVRDNRLHIAFAGPPDRFRRLSYVEVLQDAEIAAKLRDKFVLVGMTAAGLAQGFTTPTSANASAMTGVEFNANVLDNLRRGSGIVPMRSGSALVLALLVVALTHAGVYWMGPGRSGSRVFVIAIVASLALTAVLLGLAKAWFPSGALIAALVAGGLIRAWQHMTEAARALRRQEEQNRALLNAIGDAVVAIDRQGAISYVNPVANRLLSIKLEEHVGVGLKPLLQQNTERNYEELLSLVDGCLASGEPQQLDKCVIRKLDGSGELIIRATANPIRGDNDHVGGVVLAMNDITANLDASARIVHQATHDALTELPNRALLQDRLDHAISNALRNDTWVGVIFLDLDGFKRVNDSLGHTMGDSLLVQVARRLRGAMREQDTVARWGGDEFVFILEGMTRQEIVAQLAEKILRCFRKPFRIDHRELYVSGSIGISLCPKDGSDAEELLKKADAAMYRVKERGRNAYRFYSEDINSWTVKNLELEQNLHRAIKRGEMELFFQPQVALPGGEIVGMEALLRWRHPQQGLIPPSSFIPMAEENGLIHAIGDMVINAACRQAREWGEQGVQPVPISINVSPRQFARREITQILGNAIRDNAIDPALIKVEITESSIVQDVKKTLSALREFKALGVRIAIDDFGTGFSSLTHLKRFPIDELKIDQSFVRDITNDPDDAAIAQAVIALAHSMSLTVIAEGVETEAQVTFLRENNCDHMQGYYFGHPCPADEMARLLS